MKHWEDILGKRLRGFRGPDVPGQADAIWDNIDSALGAPLSPSVPFWKSTIFRMAMAAFIAAGVIIGLTVRKGATTVPSVAAPETEHPTENGEPLDEANSLESLGVPSQAEAAATAEAPLETAAPSAVQDQAVNEIDIESANAAETTVETAALSVTQDQAASEVDFESATAAAAAENLNAPSSDADSERTNSNPNPAPSQTKLEVAATTGSPPDLPEASPLLADPVVSVPLNVLPVATEDKAINDGPSRPSLRTLALKGAQPINARPMDPQPFILSIEVPERQEFAIRAFAGPTWSHFSVTDNPGQSDHFFADHSAGGGLMLEFDGHRPWSIGLAWCDYVHNLQYTETSEAPISSFGVVSVVVDIQTGDTLSVTEGQVQGVEERIRTVDRHNRFQAFSIPIEWRKVKSLNRLQFGVGVGATLQIRSGARGSVINPEGQIVRYSDQNLSRGRLAVVPTGRLFAGLRFAPAWRLDAGVAAGVQRHASRSNTGAPVTDEPSWQGRLIHGQIQVGLTRLISRVKH